MKQNIEERTAQSLRSVLDPLPPGNIEDSERLRNFLGDLEFFLPVVLSEVYLHWKHESLDGLLPEVSRKISTREGEFIGMCILMDDQSLVPYHVRLRVSPLRDVIEWMECKLGESGSGRGGMVRSPDQYSEKRIFTMLSRPEMIDWAFKAMFGDRVR
jgi:hypothetical protein